MDIIAFLHDDAWDNPFFKRLSKNDTGDAPGHQGGLVIPKDLRPYFPVLSGGVTSSSPTIDYSIQTELYIGLDRIASVSTRYQFQTWGGTRSPESRITGGLGPIRNKAAKDDILIFQRSIDNLNCYRMILVKQNMTAYSQLQHILNTRGWGTVFDVLPVTQSDLNQFEKEESKLESKPFKLFEDEHKTVEIKTIKKARSIVFRNTIRKIYNNNCAICNTGLVTTSGIYEVQASHIVPKRLNGSDDARNGLALCQRHHWAFDNGLLGIDENYKIIIPKRVLSLSQNHILEKLSQKEISKPSNTNLIPDLSALAWHRDNILVS